jgi:hypothetical protein
MTPSVQTRSTVHPNSGRASLPALRRAPPERCGGRPLVQSCSADLARRPTSQLLETDEITSSPLYRESRVVREGQNHWLRDGKSAVPRMSFGWLPG